MAGIDRGRHSETVPPVLVAALPLVVVIGVNFLMAMVLLPRLDTFLPGGGALGHHVAAGGRWRVGGGGALAAAILTLIVVNRRRLPALRQSMDAGANASVLPAVSVASLVGFGAVVAALPAFAMVREAVLSIGGGPLVSLAAATNVSPR